MSGNASLRVFPYPALPPLCQVVDAALSQILFPALKKVTLCYMDDITTLLNHLLPAPLLRPPAVVIDKSQHAPSHLQLAPMDVNHILSDLSQHQSLMLLSFQCLRIKVSFLGELELVSL